MDESVKPPKGYLFNEEAAAYIGRSPDTLTTWRCTKDEFIPYYPGRRVMYKIADLDAWLESIKVTG